MSIFSLDDHLVVGLGADTDGSLRVYLDHRSTGIHSHVADPEARAEIERAWANPMGHVFTTVPRSALCDCPEESR